jgi:hypothetical protein
MSETPQRMSEAYVTSGDYAEPEPTGWVGWIIYAAVMMILLGSFAVIQGFVALFDKSYFHVSRGGLITNTSYNGWGAAYLALGALAIAGGIALMSGRTWARILAVAVASLNAIAELAFLSAYPVWSVIMIALDVLVIWAVSVHGREVAALSE